MNPLNIDDFGFAPRETGDEAAQRSLRRKQRSALLVSNTAWSGGRFCGVLPDVPAGQPRTTLPEPKTLPRRSSSLPGIFALPLAAFPGSVMMAGWMCHHEQAM